MGAVCGTEEYDEPEESDGKTMNMGLGMMLAQAGTFMGAMAPQAQLEVLESRIRSAKMAGQTVTVRDGSVYIDYQFVGHIPQGMALSH